MPTRDTPTPEKKLTGRIAREKIKHMTVPRPPDGVIERYRKLGDASGIVSDVMDELGIPAGRDRSFRPASRRCQASTIIGPALTVRNILQRREPV